MAEDKKIDNTDLVEAAKVLEKYKEDEQTVLEQIADNTDVYEDSKQIAEQIQINTEPDTNFNDEQIADEQTARDEEQLTFLEQMVDNLSELRKDLDEIDFGGFGFFGDILALAGLTLAVALAPLTAIAGFFIGLAEAWKKIKFPVFKKLFSPITFLLKKLGELGKFLKLDKLLKPINGIKSQFSKIGDFFKVFGNWVSSSNSGFAKLTKKIFSISKLFGKYLPLIGQFLSVFKGLWEGFKVFKKTGSIVEGIKEALISFIDFLVVSFFDLGKDLISWISEKLGFKQFATMLDSFSFSKMFREGMSFIFDALGKFTNTIKENVSSIFDSFKIGNYTEGIKTFFTKIISVPIDLFREMLAFIANVFGWDSIEKILLSFNFADMYGKVIDSLAVGVNKAIEWFKELFSWSIPDKIFNISTIVSDTLTKIFKYFSELLNIDLSSLVKNLPGYNVFKKVTGFFDKTSDAGIDSKSLNKEEILLSTERENLAIKEVVRIKQLKTGQSKSENSNINTISNINNNIISNPDMSVSSDDKTLYSVLGA